MEFTYSNMEFFTIALVDSPVGAGLRAVPLHVPIDGETEN